ncbi:MAG: acyloxyacyl hydrolase [Acidobacteriota bacterium]
MLAPTRAFAQDALARGVTEFSATAAVARGIDLLQSSGGERYAMPTVSWGRVLTDVRGPAWLRGRFEWSVELTPYFAEWSSGGARGVGVAPLQWRWNLAPRRGVHAFAEVGGGALWTTAPIPDGTTGSNFMTHAGAGLRLLGGRGHGLVAGYRLHHISNGNRLRRNPGVNAHMLMLGYTWTARP